MKKLKTLVSLLTAVAVCVLLPGFNTLTVSAEEPVTYYVKYIEGDTKSEWRYQVGATWDDKGVHRELYYMNQDIKDGDLVIVDGNVSGNPLNIPVRLGNLTILHGSGTVVQTNGIDECFVLRDSVVAINGDIKNAYVYNNARCSFNDNVDTLQVTDDQGLHAYITVAGTVKHLTGSDPYQTYYDFYSFAKGKLVIEDGRVKTAETDYSTTPAAEQAPSAPKAPSQAPSGEYDDVPKTGESNLVFYLLGISALCFAGRYCMKKAK